MVIGIDQSTSFTLSYVLEMACPVLPQSLFITELQQGTYICMCGDDSGNIYFKKQNVQALTEVGKPTIVT